MSEESISQGHYNYFFDESVSAYSFSTDKGAIYRIAFTKDHTFSSIARTEEFENQYQLIIERVSEEKVSHDPKIAATIGLIIVRFFETRSNSLLCVCSEEDGKEEYRFRAFARWYKTSQAKEYILKEDRILEIEYNGTVNKYYTSFLYHKENPNKNRLLDVYDSFQTALSK